MKNQRIAYLFFAASMLLASCSGMNDDFQEYLDRGEINYIGKVDSVSVLGGDCRIRFTWKFSEDPRIERCAIYWTTTDTVERRDSATFSINRSALDADGYMSVIFPIPEGSYLFSMYNTGTKGYRSVREEVTGVVYGEQYRSTLTPRRIGNVATLFDRAVIDWKASDNDEMSSTLHYLNASGQAASKMVSSSESQTELTDFKRGTEYFVTSRYMPGYYALDQFEVSSDKMVFSLFYELNKRAFERYVLPGDNNTQYDDGSWSWNSLFDNVAASNQAWHTNGGSRYFTIDLGTTTKLTRYILWHRLDDYAFASHNLKKWRVYGSDNPKAGEDESYWATPSGGFTDDWYLLAENVTVKPSGDGSEVTQEDKDYAAKGFAFDFLDAPPVRYVRFYVEEIWDGGNDYHISELSFWGQ
jgi:hypothetical protein